MCGICGWINIKNNLDPDTLIAMNNIVKYRGPDDEGYALFSLIETKHFRGQDSKNIELPLLDKNVIPHNTIGAFGHRRLSILDLSKAGHQPMSSKDDLYCLTYNGELYNYIELKEELIHLGYTFTSSCDTEVLLKSYEEWGEDCVLHFNGMWAFALWDSIEKKLFCSRDRLGAKPFYYYLSENQFIFASEIKQLCQNPQIERIINDEILVSQVMWGITDYSEETLIKDVKALMGGTNLTINIDFEDNSLRFTNIQITRYWDIDTTQEKYETAIEDAFTAHKNAVEIRTRSDVPLGILLSGGLDSSSLVAEVSEYYKKIGISPENIKTFTSCYNDFDEGNEKNFAHIVNEYCGTKECFIYPNEFDTWGWYKKMIWHCEGKVALTALGAFLTLNEISKIGMKVLLNGQGSDETMFGYERYYSWYLKDILHRDGIKGAIKSLKEAAKNSKLSASQLLKYYIYFNSFEIRKHRCLNRMRPYISHYTEMHFRNNKSVKKYLCFKTLSQLQYNELRGTQLTHILRCDDRMYMAFSMESRVPFIDYRYIEAAVKIPEEEKIVNGYTKYPLRKFISNRLPNEIVWRKNKMGWPSPRNRWIQRFDKKEMEKLFDNPRSKKYFNIESLLALYKQNPEAYAIEQFINIELFMRMFDVKSA